MAVPVSIAKLTHRIKLCSERDATVDGGMPVLTRDDVLTVWAQIQPKRGSFFVNGTVAMENRENPSHYITIRYRSDLQIRSTAWVYEERRASPPRWYKVLSVQDRDENGRWFQLEVRLVESADDITRPAGAEDRIVDMPKGAWS